MIPAEEALAIAQERKRQQPERRALTDRELVAFNFLDYTIDRGVYDGFNGEPFEIKVPAEIAQSADVIAAVKQKFEEGRWTVGVFPIVEGDAITAFQMVFCPKEVAVATKKEIPLPVIVGTSSTGTLAQGQTRLLVRMPTRGRPAQAIEVLAKYRNMAGMPIQIEVVVDYNDEAITSEFLYRLNALGCTVTFGEHKSKIEACNGGRLTEWDILVLGSDDMVPVIDGWAKRICELYDEYFPHFDGCLHLDDGYAHDRVATISILGRRYYNHYVNTPLGRQVYHPAYKSLFSDDFHTQSAQLMNRIIYVPEVLIEHQHPAAGKVPTDALYVLNDRMWEQDKATYERHKAENFGLKQPLLSILICTYPARREMLERLLDELYWQKQCCMYDVEIVIDHKPADSLGQKRQRPLDKARGKYSCYLDDDDWIDSRYIERICNALVKDPDADCASLVGTLTTNGDRPERFEHSLKHDRWATLENGTHIRFPNHLNAIRTSIMREVGFSNLTYTEDHDISKRMLPRLKKEVSTGDTALYHYWYRSKQQPTGAVK